MFAKPIVAIMRFMALVILCSVSLSLLGCSSATGVLDGDGGNDNGQDDGADDGVTDDSDGGSSDGLPIGEITGNEVMLEAARSEDGNGGSYEQDERFTATFTLSPVNADESEIFINDELTTMIFGDLSGAGSLTYEESSTDIDPELECTTSTSSGSVQWDVDVEGTYEYIPALGTIRIEAMAVSVSSPSFDMTFTTPGCPELDSVSPINYTWQGPGQGVWGFVTIVLENGHFEYHLDNPLFNDLGELDSYDISVDLGAAP